MPKNESPSKETGVWLTGIKESVKKALADYIWPKKDGDAAEWPTAFKQRRENIKKGGPTLPIGIYE